MNHPIAGFASRTIARRPGRVIAAVLILLVLSAWRVSNLHINHNQLDLIPQNIPEVQSTRQMIKIVGGVGFFLMALKSDDPDHMKDVADDLAPKLLELPEVRKVTYKQDVGFIFDRMALFVETPDMQEAYKRMRKKIRVVLQKNNPFAFTLTEIKDEPLDFSDLAEKYMSVNKKRIDDPYYVDQPKEMLLFVIKPSGDSTDLDFVQRLVNAVEKTIADYNANNTRDAKLVEGYETLNPEATVTYGYTGGYKRNLDDSETMRAALIPTSVVAFLGILIYLLFTLRRVSQIALLMITLLMSVVFAFGFCEITIGELNTITAILGAILMGLGIDFGIHFIYRFREEFTRHEDLETALLPTLAHSGRASATSAMTTASALYVLTLAEFKGFSHFGMIAGTGILLTFVLMYIFVPAVYCYLDKFWPKFKENLRFTAKAVDEEDARKRYPYAKPILIASVSLTAALGYFAQFVEFDYDARSMLSADRPSLILQDEINKRYQISADPIGYYVETLEEAKALYSELEKRRKSEGSTIDMVASIYTLVPPKEQQEANREILDKLQLKVEQLSPSMLKPKEAEYFEKYKYLLDAQPFTMDDVPGHIATQFRPVPESGEDGYLTFVYPNVSIWNGEQLVAFAEEAGSLEINGKTYQSAGMAVLYAHLSQVVLRDGKKFTVLAAIAILLIILGSFRTVGAVVFAMLPLTAGMIWMLGCMVLTNWQVNFMNIVVFPVVFGYGISNGVHLYHRFLESGSVMVALRHTGRAVLASSVTTLIGWGAMLVSNHRGLESMGILACFGIAGTVVVSFTVMPALLQILQDRRKSES